tara:strand:- start:1651 stop:2694 length:1044 start_codon:yes stop_codon:yes gene_type:complete
MANANQGTRSGNPFGRPHGGGYAGNDWENVVLKPGYIVKIRDRFHLVEAVEGLTVDLFFTDQITYTVSSSLIASGTDKGLTNYGDQSIFAQAESTSSVTNQAMTILSPDFDSDHITFNDLEPYKGHLYHLAPCLPSQPKFLSAAGEWLSTDGTKPSDGGTPIGFPPAALIYTDTGDDNIEVQDVSTYGAANTTAAGTVDAFGSWSRNAPIGTVSAKLYLKHPSGVPKWVLDEAPETSSGSATSGNILGLSGYIDGQISPIEDPDWTYSIWIEHGENNLPSFRLVNDSEEYLLDGRVHLQGWKYRVVELSMDQLKQIRDRSGGRLTFKIINPAGIPTPGTLLAEYFPK